MAKLFTHEDPQMVHKTLGFLSVLSFIWRYAFVYPRTGSLGFDGSAFDWMTMALHTLLSCSSFIFRVPRKRIANKPMIIYEEYRQHATVFTLRCMAVFVVATLFPDAPSWLSPIVVAAHHKWADYITSQHGKEGNTAVRSTSERLNMKEIYKKVALFFSFYQFLAIASHISPHERLADLAFNALIAIQSSAFMMTLYRKRIVRGRTHMSVYGFCLVVSSFHIIRLIGSAKVCAVATAFLVRINFRSISKYQLWTAYLLLPTALKNVPAITSSYQTFVDFLDSIMTSPAMSWAHNNGLVAVAFWYAVAVVISGPVSRFFSNGKSQPMSTSNNADTVTCK